MAIERAPLTILTTPWIICGVLLPVLPVLPVLRGVLAGVFGAHSMVLGIAQGNVLVPPYVVEIEIEQRAVHVQQHGVDCRSVEQHSSPFAA